MLQPEKSTRMITSYQEAAQLFNAATPEQVKDQVIWQGIRRILDALATSDDDRQIIKVQDRIFRLAQDKSTELLIGR